MPFYESEKVPVEQINPALNTFVSVIASYNVEGECIPLYFRHMNSDGTYIDIPITKILGRKPNSIFGTIYQCEYLDHGYKKQISLYFHRKENKWSVRLV